MEKYLDTRLRIREVVRNAINKMSGNSMVEDPGIPLVDRRNGKYSKYVEDDTGSQSEGGSMTGFWSSRKFENISFRLSYRKKMINRRRFIVNIEFALAMIGIILMLIETELFIQNVILKTDIVSIVLKSLISATTIMLLVAVMAYHITGIKIVMADNSLEDWRLAVSFPATYVKIAIELVVCVIHPIPGNIEYDAVDPAGATRKVSIDSILSILMLLRLYLVGKFMVVHSKLLTDTATQSLGALNKVKINTVFVFKALMSTMPGTILICIMLAILIVMTWSMRTCEIYFHKDKDHSTFFNSMWMIAITFLTVGYGDIYPNTYCGRFVAVSTGLMGVGTTALLVAVLASKLEQTRAEKYVHNFVSRAQLDKQRKNAAADVIKNVIKLWKMKQQNVDDDKRRIKLHGKLLQSVTTMRDAKNEKSSIGETTIGFIEISKVVDDIYDMVDTMQENNKEMRERVSTIESSMSEMSAKMDALYSAIMRR